MSTVISLVGLGALFIVFGVFVRHRGSPGHGCRSGHVTTCHGCRMHDGHDQPGSMTVVSRNLDMRQSSVPRASGTDPCGETD